MNKIILFLSIFAFLSCGKTEKEKQKEKIQELEKRQEKVQKSIKAQESEREKLQKRRLEQQKKEQELNSTKK